jgi:hypothetical protein
MLEQSCEMVEDILIMPNDLQADVIVPIVNFMYTGTLEFQYNMYEKLLKTSREMNMTVLSKLLEAHRQTSAAAIAKSSPPVLLNKNAANVRSQPKVFYQKPAPTKTVFYKQGQTIIKTVSPTKPNIPEPIQIVTRFQPDKNNSRPSRFTLPDENVPDTEGSFESISYESKPLLTASQVKREDENSPFESLRRGYTNNKRVASTSSSQSPPSKKPNLDDIKAEAEAQRQRNELSGDGEEIDDNGSDADYDADQYFEEENDDSDDDGNRRNSSGTVVKQTTKQITVNDCSGGNIDHAKILGEVLKKYPNLVKNPKNIKLKIMQKPSNPNSPQTTAIVRVVKQESPGRAVVKPSPVPTQPKKIDAKTMHELIRMGAENMKGPWLCLECGSGGRPISIPTYKKFRAHLINVHKQKIDPRICEHCGLKPARRIELIQHQLIAHNINPPADVPLFRCTHKGCVFVTQKEEMLMKHKREVHKEFQQKCKYCPKVFGKEFLLTAHMRAVHRHMAKNDDNLEFSEDEEYEPAGSSKDEQFSELPTKKLNKIEILSNIEIPLGESFGVSVSQPSSEAEGLTSVASGIAASLGIDDDQFNIEQQLAQVHGEYDDKKDNSNSGMITKLVAEDGTELELTAAQKDEIIQQLQSQGATLSDNVVMVLDQGQLNVENVENNIMVMFSEPQETNVSDSITNSVATMKEIENAEIVFQDDAITATTEKLVESEKSKLIADLEGDWTEDDEGSQSESKTEEPAEAESSQEVVTSDEQFELIPPGKSEIVEENKPEEANGKLKDILDDWDDDDTDMKDDTAEEQQSTLESAADISMEDEKNQSEIGDVTNESQENVDEDKPSETIDAGELSQDKELPESEEIPVLEVLSEDKESKKSPKLEAASTTEKSKITVSDLLDEWSDS